MVTVFSHRVPVLAVVRIALDAGIFLLAFFIGGQIGVLGVASEGGGLLLAATLFAAIMVTVLGAFGLYSQAEEERPARTTFRLAGALLVAAYVASVGVSLLTHGTAHRYRVIDSVLIAVVGILPTRRALRSRSRRHQFDRQVLVLGTGPEALAVGQALWRAPPGYRLVGFYPLAGQEPGAVPRDQTLPSTRPLEDTVRELGVSEVIVAVREQRGGCLPLRQLLACRLHGVQVTDLPRFFERVTGEVPLDWLKASWLIYGAGFRHGVGRTLAKRAFDIVFALLLLILAIPVMVVTALAIFFESGTPINYRQPRVGLGGHTFDLLKFRSMQTDAEKDGTPQWAASNDPRVTAVGRFIRRTRIDELPQVFNVLKGEMSFVGPRPERPYFVAQLTERIPFYGARHSVKPGVTGWAQVRYSYGASFEDATKKLQYDLYYVKNHTLLLDLVILLETVSVVVAGNGAR